MRQKLVTILVVDDDKLALKYIKKLLERNGYKILTAESGAQALKTLTEKKGIGLILLDLGLKDIDGLEVLRSIRQKKELSRLPIIIVTGRISAEQKVEGLKLGADDYITKPFETKELIARIEARLRIVRLEDELYKSREIFSNMFETAVDCILLYDLDGFITQANPAATEFLGYSKHEIIGKNLTDFLTFESQRLLFSYKEKKLPKSKVRGLSFSAVNKNGKMIPAEISVSMFRDANNKQPAGYIAIIKDISEREKAQFEIREKSKYLEALNSITKFANTCLNQEEIFDFTVKQSLELFNFDLAILAIRNKESQLLEVESTYPRFSDETKKQFKLDIRNFFNELEYKKSLIGQTALYVPKIFESSTSLSFISNPINYKDRTLGAFLIFTNQANYFDEKKLGVFEQISNQIAPAVGNSILYERLQKKSRELIVKNEELKNSQERLLKTERLAAIGEFSAQIAHEIRNPLVIIGGFARMLYKKLADTRLQEFAQTIIEEAKRMETLLDKVLTYARPSNNSIEKRELVELVERVAGKFETEFEEKDIEFRSEFQYRETEIHFDKDQIHQVLLNIIKNAIESMPKGGKLKVGTGRNGDYFQLYIKDSGVGIPPDYMDKLALPFFTTKKKGTGLGLAICNRIISEHQGFIRINSKLNQGTTVTLNFPLHFNKTGS